MGRDADNPSTANDQDDSPSAGAIRDLGDVIEVPIVEEKVEVIKKPVVKEVIRIHKRRVTDEKTVETDLRSEDIEVDHRGPDHTEEHS